MKNQQAGNIKRATQAARIWEARRAEIEHLYVMGDWSQGDLANHYKMSQQGMARVLKRLGIKAKTRGRAGHLNGRFIDGTQSTAYRQMIDKTHCAECQATEALVIHHKDHDHTNNVLENLQVLCSPCHSSHHKREYWRRKKAGL